MDWRDEAVIIHKQRDGKLTETDAAALAGLLIKAGYTVAVRQEKIGTSTSRIWTVHFNTGAGTTDE